MAAAFGQCGPRQVAAGMLVVALAAAAGADQPQETLIALDGCAYASPEAAQKAWRPIHPDSPPMEIDNTAAGPALRLRCNFKTNDNWRVGWDCGGTWDLRRCGKIFVTVTADGDRLARMIAYFRSRNGWYVRDFVAPAGRSRITLSRNQFRTEGSPAGWGKVSTIRLAVIRDEPIDRTILVGGISALAQHARVAVYRNDAGVGKESAAPRYARQMADAIDRIGIACELIGDGEVAAGGLADKKVAILPLNPVLPQAAGAEIRKFVGSGGRLIVCYLLPEPLGELLGVRVAGSIDGGGGRLDAIRFHGREDRPKITIRQLSWIASRVTLAKGTHVRGRWLNDAGEVTELPAITRNENGYFIAHVLTEHDESTKDRLVLEMLGRLWPGAWKEVYRRRLAQLGKVAGLGGLEELTAAVTGAPDQHRREAARRLLSEAGQLTDDAASAEKYGDAIMAAELIERAQRLYARGYASVVPPRAGEFRAVWCHDPVGVAGWSWEKAMGKLAEAGFNAVIVNMLWGGGAAYPSEVLPAVEKSRGRDLLAECLAAAKTHGIAVHVWKVNWNLSWVCPKSFRSKMQQTGRLQRVRRGRTIGWLCPSDPGNQKLERDSMLEIVRRYPVAGIHFDYIRYPHGDACYCAGCRRRFERAHRLQVQRWPEDVHSGRLRDQFRQFRRDNITRLVADVAKRAREIRPDIFVSAAVFWNWPADRDNVGQDWKLWVERGYLDFVCPMQYTTSAAGFEARLRATRRWVGGAAPLIPGIGATLGLSPDGTLQQIQIARKHASGGFVLFNYDGRLAQEHLPLLRLGATSEKTEWKSPQRGKMLGGSE